MYRQAFWDESGEVLNVKEVEGKMKGGRRSVRAVLLNTLGGCIWTCSLRWLPSSIGSCQHIHVLYSNTSALAFVQIIELEISGLNG